MRYPNDTALGINWMNRDSSIIPIQEGEPDALSDKGKQILQRIRQSVTSSGTPNSQLLNFNHRKFYFNLTQSPQITG